MRRVVLVIGFCAAIVLGAEPSRASASITSASIEPTSGPYGTVVTAHFSGVGVIPSYEFVLWFGQMDASSMVNGTIVGSFMTDPDGTFTTTVVFTVPVCAPISSNGGHTVTTRVLTPGPWALWPATASTPPPFGPAGTPPLFTITSPLATSCMATLSPLVVTNTADSGSGSLRAAIEFANAHSGPDTIQFNIPTTDSGFNGQWFTIRPLSPLPALTDSATTIDGRTQTAFSGDTNAFGPEIVVNGGLVAIGSGLMLASDGNRIESLVVNGFRGGGSGIDIRGSTNTVAGSYVGLDATGVLAAGNRFHGISVLRGTGNVIGGSSPADRNVISGNDGQGIHLGSSGNFVRGNLIGTDRTGTGAVGNGLEGVFIWPCPFVECAGEPAQNNVVGGPSHADRNVISGNNDGVWLQDSRNLVQGNFIGTDISGTRRLGNRVDGIRIVSAPAGCAKGSCFPATDADANVVIGNVVSGNGQNGMTVTRFASSGPTPDQNVIWGNLIGTDASGANALSNGRDGVSLSGATGNLVGGTAAGARNVISSNRMGVIIGTGATRNVIAGNYIGTDVTGAHPLGNQNGIFFKILDVDLPADNLIGGSGPGAGNLISGNLNRGVAIGGMRNRVEGNWIGTSANGADPLPNGGSGVGAVAVCGADCFENVIGGVQAGAGNTIAYNGGAGVSAGVSTNPSQLNLRITRNSIHSNGGLGIDLFPDGVTANDPGDADAGPNGLQNFPIIGTTEVSDGLVMVTGGLDTQHPETATVELYTNGNPDPSGYGEGQSYAASTTPAPNGCFAATFVARGGVITSTATDASGNTSEFSRAIPQGTTKAVIVLTPAASTNLVGTTHTVSVTLRNSAGGPVPCAAVTFRVTGANTAGGTGATDINGTTTFGYTGVWAGDDTITATSGAANGTAAKTWTFPASTAGSASGGGRIASGGGAASFGFTAKGAKGQLELNDRNGRVVHGDINVTVVSGTHATLYGFATVDGTGGFQFRVDVDDRGEPGSADTFAIVMSDGYSAEGVLVAGNIQVR